MNYHILVDDKFIDGFIDDSETVSKKKTNRYFIRGNKQAALYVSHPKAEWFVDLWCNDFKNILGGITDQDKIFIHWYDLYVGKLMLTIDKNIPLYVVPWGGDFYEDPFLYHINWIHDPITLHFVKKEYLFPKKWSKHPIRLFKQLWWILNYKYKINKEFEIKKRTVHRVNYFVGEPNSYFEVELIKKIYSIDKLQILPFLYNQNFDLANELRIKQNNNSTLNIQLGNSATESNNHVDCISLLGKFKKEDIKLILPLSYGTPKYAEFVKKNCLKIFPIKSEFIVDFMQRDAYIKKLNQIDVAIMFHNRSQAFGNCITLLTLGKKLFLKNNNPLFQMFQNVGIIVFDANTIETMSFEEFSKPLTEGQIQSNIERISNLFSEKMRLEYLRNLLN